jgi:hypothetical protein
MVRSTPHHAPMPDIQSGAPPHHMPPMWDSGTGPSIYHGAPTHHAPPTWGSRTGAPIHYGAPVVRPSLPLLRRDDNDEDDDYDDNDNEGSSVQEGTKSF